MKPHCLSWAATRAWRERKRLELADARFEAFCRLAGLHSSPQSSMRLWDRPGVFISVCPTNPFAIGTTPFNAKAA